MLIIQIINDNSLPQTMIEILPQVLADHVEKKCGSLAGNLTSFNHQSSRINNLGVASVVRILDFLISHNNATYINNIHRDRPNRCLG